MFYDIRRFIFSQTEPNRTEKVSNRTEIDSARFGSVRFQTEPIPSLIPMQKKRENT